MDEDDIVAAHNTSCVVVLIAGNGSVRRLLALPAMIEEMFDSNSFGRQRTCYELTRDPASKGPTFIFQPIRIWVHKRSVNHH